MKTFNRFISEQVSADALKKVEVYADKLFSKLNIDVEFTKHFAERINDSRNGKDINSAELVKLFRETFKKHGKKIAKLPDGANKVIRDMSDDINMPFVFKWDEKSQEWELIAKTIMRKKNFKSSNEFMDI